MRILVIICLSLAWSLGTQPDAKDAEKIFAAGEKLYEDGKYKQAADTLAVSASMFDQLNRPLDRVRSINLQAESLANLGQCDQAGALLQQSLATINSQPGDNRVLLADIYYYTARYTGGCARKFDESIKIMQKSIDIKNQLYEDDDPSLAFDFTFLGYVYNSKGKYDSALLYLNKAMSIREKHLSQDDVETSHTLFNLAASYEGKSDLGKALSTNLRALEIRSKKLGTSNATISNSINSLGRVYRKLGNPERALEYYRQALEMRKSTLGATHPNVAASYYEIGNLYGTISNYHAALEYVQQGNRILEANTQVANDVLPTYQVYEGKMYGLIGDHENARASIKKGIAVAEKALPATHPYRAIAYNMAAEYYGDIADIKDQTEFAKKAIEIYRASYGVGSEREGDVVSKLATTYAKLGDDANALKLYSDALQYFNAKLGPQNPKVAALYLGVGDVFTSKGYFDQAVKAYEAALQSIDTAQNKPSTLRIVRSRAKMFDKQDATDLALDGYRTALKIVDDIAQGYNNEAARAQLEKDRRAMYTSAMNALWKLYEKKKDASLLAEAFSMAEKSKSTLLLENTKDQHAKTFAGVPDSLVSKERDMRIELAFYKTSLYQSTKTKDTATARALEKTIFDLERELEGFKSQLEKDFPAYYKLKYRKNAVALADIQQQLQPNTTLLEYFVSDSAIYCFNVSSNSSEWKRQAIDQSVRNAIDGYQKSLTDLKFIVNEPARADSLYLSTSRSLFSMLMIPEPTQKMIVIPDDFLAQLNFGTLLYSDPTGKNYTTLPYLNNKTVVSYAYSAAFLNDKRTTNNDAFAGFAPSYEQKDYTGLDSIEHPMTALVMRSGDLPLPGATQEVDIISKLMSGRSWIDEEATETNFKKYGSDYGVLHLAMHSLLNEEEPRYSELLFNHNRDSENDGYLTISEIYNLKLNAQMVVLSSCSSGFGKIQHGEGAISLSRAFSYAGCPSVVMSLWKVPDQVTTTIMKNFYESLTEGLSKDEALRAAQMKFVAENTDPLYRHPYYWAGFVVIGDTRPLESSSNMIFYIAGIVALGLGALFFIRRK